MVLGPLLSAAAPADRDHTELGGAVGLSSGIELGRVDGGLTWQECTDCAAFVPPTLEVQLDRQVRRITACGELDCATVSVLAGSMAMVIALGPGDSTVDIAGVSFIDATGLGCLVGFANQLEVVGARMYLVGVTPRLLRVFEVAGLSTLVDTA